MSWPRTREYLYMAIAAFLAIMYAVMGTMDYQDALIAEASKPILTFPIPYKAVVCQSTYYREKPRCAYYTGKEE